MRLIDADALMNEVLERYCRNCGRRKGLKKGKRIILYAIGEAPCRACDRDDMKDEIDNAPTIDAAPVVRCKDCVHANITEEGYLYGTCNHRLKGGIGHLITPQFFCAYGEREDDGDIH